MVERPKQAPSADTLRAMRRVQNLEALSSPLGRLFKNVGLAGGGHGGGNTMTAPGLTTVEFVEDAVKIAKENPERAIDLLLNRLNSERNDAVDTAWGVHENIVKRLRETKRDQIIADFIAMTNAVAERAPIIMLGRATVEAVVEALMNAGYTDKGKAVSQQDAANIAKLQAKAG